MSYQAGNWASAQRVGDPTLKILLLVMANYANKQNQIWYTQEELAYDAEVSDRTVRRALVRLREMGLIDTEPMKQANGCNGRLRITLLINGADKDSSADNLSGRSGHPDVRAARTPECPDGADITVAAHKQPLEQPLEQPKDLVRSKRSKPTDAEIDQVFEERFWPAYPKRKGTRGKPEAAKKFREIIKSSAHPIVTVEKIIDAATALAAEWTPKVARKPADAEYIPMAATWLNKRRWDDEHGPPPEGGETMFDLANHFENRVKATDHGNSSNHDDGHGLIDG